MSIDSTGANLEYYKKRAKALLKLYRARDPHALQRVRTHHPRFARAANEAVAAQDFVLADAQLAVARECGLSSWRQLRERVSLAGNIEPQLLAQWSGALSSRDAKAVDSLLSRYPGLKYQEFYPLEKLPDYHSATYGPLLWAVWIEDYAIVRALLKHGVDPNHEAQSCLPLLLASEAMSDLLISHGADVNRYCINGGTPLLWSVGDMRRVRYLIGKGADVNLAKPNSGETPLMLLMGCDDEDEGVAIATLLVQHGADVNARARSGLDDEPIFNHGNDQNISQGGMTALHLAAEFGKAKLAEFLLRHGADPQAMTMSRRTVYFTPEDKPFPFAPFAGETPLDWAVRGGQHQVVRLLGGDLLDDLYWAAATGVEEQVERLLQQGADVNQIHCHTGKTPLDAAVAKRRRSICKILLAHGARWTCDVADAVELGIPEVVEAALNSDASLKNRLVASPRRLLKLLLRGGEVQREIIEMIAHVPPQTEADLVLAIGLRDRSLVTEIRSRNPKAITAALRALPELACFCVGDPDVLEAALDAGADIEARDEMLSGTPLHWAIKFNQRRSVELLLSRGADANAVLTIGDAGATPLLLVVQQRSDCSMDLVEPLLQHRADPNWQMHNGYTALDILQQRWGARPDAEYKTAIDLLRGQGGKTASELATAV